MSSRCKQHLDYARDCEKCNRNRGVHEGHCCKEHGCKYGEDRCPVVDGFVVQEFPCEDCGEEAGARNQHQDKCCRLHGCNLDGNCPVEVGGIPQNGPCALCPPVGKVGLDNATADVLRAMADLIDDNARAETQSAWTKLPDLGDVMRKLEGRANPKLVVQLLHVLGETSHQQTSAMIRPTGEWSSGEMELEIQIESGDRIHSGMMYLSREFMVEMVRLFPHHTEGKIKRTRLRVTRDIGQEPMKLDLFDTMEQAFAWADEHRGEYVLDGSDPEYPEFTVSAEWVEETPPDTHVR